jgi:hypothetical protein
MHSVYHFFLAAYVQDEGKCLPIGDIRHMLQKFSCTSALPHRAWLIGHCNGRPAATRQIRQLASSPRRTNRAHQTAACTRVNQ